MTLEPGRQIGESLRLVRLIGRGAMGSVWLADHLGLQSQVAVKFMAQAMLEDPVAVRRFQQEAKAAAEIRSPHVVRVFDHGTTDDGPYIVMELLEGESLERRLKRQGPISMHELVLVVTQACKALARAHERGIIHRDIKPGNIFLAQDDELFVKVLDFGVAKFSGQEAIDMTAQGNMVGTPAYMSPEQLFHGKSIDHRGDLWSLGVVAYHALTGQRPFDGVTLGELCIAIKRGEFVPPTKLRHDVPPEVDAWFARAFASQLEARFANAKEMAVALEHCVGVSSAMGSVPSLVGSMPSLSAPSPALATFPGTSASTPPGAPKKRRWWIAAAAAGAVALLAGGALLFAGGGTKAAVTAAAAPTAIAAAPTTTPTPTPTSTPTSTPTPTATPTSTPTATSRPVEASSVAPRAARTAEPDAAKTKVPPPPPPASDSAPGQGDERTKRAGEQLGI